MTGIAIPLSIPLRNPGSPPGHDDEMGGIDTEPWRQQFRYSWVANRDHPDVSQGYSGSRGLPLPNWTEDMRGKGPKGGWSKGFGKGLGKGYEKGKGKAAGKGEGKGGMTAMCFNCGQRGHSWTECFSLPCTACGSPHHNVNECPRPRHTLSCSFCGRPNHLAEACMARKRQSGSWVWVPGQAASPLARPSPPEEVYTPPRPTPIESAGLPVETAEPKKLRCKGIMFCLNLGWGPQAEASSSTQTASPASAPDSVPQHPTASCSIPQHQGRQPPAIISQYSVNLPKPLKSILKKTSRYEPGDTPEQPHSREVRLSIPSKGGSIWKSSGMPGEQTGVVERPGGYRTAPIPSNLIYCLDRSAVLAEPRPPARRLRSPPRPGSPAEGLLQFKPVSKAKPVVVSKPKPPLLKPSTPKPNDATPKPSATVPKQSATAPKPSAIIPRPSATPPKTSAAIPKTTASTNKASAAISKSEEVHEVSDTESSDSESSSSSSSLSSEELSTSSSETSSSDSDSDSDSESASDSGSESPLEATPTKQAQSTMPTDLPLHLQPQAHPLPRRQQLIKELYRCLATDKKPSKSDVRGLRLQLYVDLPAGNIRKSTVLDMQKKYSGKIYHAAGPRRAALSSSTTPAAIGATSSGSSASSSSASARKKLAEDGSLLFSVFPEHKVIACEQLQNGEALGALYFFEMRPTEEGNAEDTLKMQLWEVMLFTQKEFMRKRVILDGTTLEAAAEFVFNKENYAKVLEQLEAEKVVQRTAKLADFLGYICRVVHKGEVATRVSDIFEDPSGARAETAERLRQEKQSLMTNRRLQSASYNKGDHTPRKRFAIVQRGALFSAASEEEESPGKKKRRLQRHPQAKVKVKQEDDELYSSSDDIVEITALLPEVTAVPLKSEEPAEKPPSESGSEDGDLPVTQTPLTHNDEKADSMDIDEEVGEETTKVGDLVAIDPYEPNKWLARVVGICKIDGFRCLRIRWHGYIYRERARNRHYRAVSDDQNQPDIVPEHLATVDQIQHITEKDGMEVKLSPKEFRLVMEQFGAAPEGPTDEWDWDKACDVAGGPGSQASAPEGQWIWAPEKSESSTRCKMETDGDSRAPAGYRFIVDDVEDDIGKAEETIDEFGNDRSLDAMASDWCSRNLFKPGPQPEPPSEQPHDEMPQVPPPAVKVEVQPQEEDVLPVCSTDAAKVDSSSPL